VHCATAIENVGLIDNGYRVKTSSIYTTICQKNKKHLRKPTTLCWLVRQRRLGLPPERSHRSQARLQPSPRKRANCPKRTNAAFRDYKKKLSERLPLRNRVSHRRIGVTRYVPPGIVIAPCFFREDLQCETLYGPFRRF
jgi:hypothetical protein